MELKQVDSEVDSEREGVYFDRKAKKHKFVYVDRLRGNFILYSKQKLAKTNRVRADEISCIDTTLIGRPTAHNYTVWSFQRLH